MHLIIASIIALLLLLNPAPVQAQLNITEVESNQLDALVKKAFESTNAGEFTSAEGYWTDLIKLYP